MRKRITKRSFDISHAYGLVYFIFFLIPFFSLPLTGQTDAGGAAITSNPLEHELDSIHMQLNNGQIGVAIESAELLMEKTADFEDLSLYKRAASALFQGYCRNQDYAQAIDLINLMIEQAKAADDEGRLAIAHTNMGIVYFFMGDHEKAATYYLKNLAYLEKEERKGNTDNQYIQLKAGAYSNLAGVIKFIDKKRAEKYYHKAIAKAKLGGNEMQIATFFFNIGLLYYEMEDYEYARNYVDSALVKHLATNNRNGVLKCKSMLGGIAEQEGNNMDAMKYYKDSYKQLYIDSIGGWNKGNSFSMARIAPFAYGIAELYLKLDSLQQAHKYALENYEMNKGVGNISALVEATKLMSEIEQKRGNTDKAFDFLNEHLMLKDSLDIKDMEKQVLIKEQEFQVSLKEKDIALLKEQATAKLRAIWMMIIICVLLLFSLLLIVNRFGLRRSLLKEKAAKQAEVISVKEQSLANLALLNHSKTQLINQLKGELNVLAQNGNGYSNIDKLIHSLETKVNQEEDWEAFQRHFETIHPDFFKTLNGINGQLTNLDLKHCAFIKLNLSNNEAARLLGIDPKSVQMARYRLKKKLPLKTEDSLNELVRSL